VKEGTFGWFNDRDISTADLHKAASADAPKTLAGRLASAVQRTQALGGALPAARRFRDIPHEVDGSSLGWVENAGQVQALLSVSSPDVVARYKTLGSRGLIEKATIARAVVAAGGPDSDARFRALKADDFGWVEEEGLARALLAVSDDGVIDRYRALGQTSLSFGWIDQAGVAQAEVARGAIFAPLPAVPATEDDKK
jgi:hypothetical protein